MRDNDVVRTSVAMKKAFHKRITDFIKNDSLGFESYSEFARTAMRTFMEERTEIDSNAGGVS